MRNTAQQGALFLDRPHIFLKGDLISLCLFPQLHCIPGPCFELCLGHFLLGNPGIVRLVCFVVNIPNGIFLALGVVFLSCADHPAGLGLVLCQRILAVIGVDSGINQEPLTAVAAPLGNEMLR